MFRIQTDRSLLAAVSISKIRPVITETHPCNSHYNCMYSSRTCMFSPYLCTSTEKALPLRCSPHSSHNIDIINNVIILLSCGLVMRNILISHFHMHRSESSKRILIQESVSVYWYYGQCTGHSSGSPHSLALLHLKNQKVQL